MELEERFRADKEHLAHANALAAKYHNVKRASVEAKKMAEEADAKRKGAEESLDAALASLMKAEDKVRSLEQEIKRVKVAAYEKGSQEAQDEMGRQLSGVCNEYYMDAWDDAIAMLNLGQTTLPPKPIKLPFPGAIPPPRPEAVLNSPPPQLSPVTVDLEEVESAEAEGPIDAAPHEALDGGSTAPGLADPNDS